MAGHPLEKCERDKRGTVESLRHMNTIWLKGSHKLKLAPATDNTTFPPLHTTDIITAATYGNLKQFK